MTIKNWLSRLEVKPINTSDEIETAMQAEINALLAENERLKWALKDASVAAIAEALEVDALRAELAALRAGSGEAVGEVRNSEVYFYNGMYTDKTDVPNGTKLYARPQPSAVPVVRELVEALEAVEALIEHQYTGTREGMSYLQNTCDDAQVALTTGQQWLKENT